MSKHDLKPSGTFFRKIACDLGFAGCQKNQKSNFSQLWAHEKNEQVMLGTIPTLPATETYQKHKFLMKQCSKNENLHATLDSKVAKFQDFQKLNLTNRKQSTFCYFIFKCRIYDKMSNLWQITESKILRFYFEMQMFDKQPKTTFCYFIFEIIFFN